ncbi:hypothetical protein C9374_004814 [Naegleria lovaniensis]|uniref:Uncharacterized protein n=1 Tax=Naegleria lovaniensis TaxID=51637 RepID=A0AA88KJ30_NAELO|nr:uncharacterized protein C9374_004814 [Naegleria lovaniensis]KAG2382847.1 hypothetical protein C9374_004814 [Naegleria lovaniensis]
MPPHSTSPFFEFKVVSSSAVSSNSQRNNKKKNQRNGNNNNQHTSSTAATACQHVNTTPTNGLNNLMHSNTAVHALPIMTSCTGGNSLKKNKKNSAPGFSTQSSTAAAASTTTSFQAQPSTQQSAYIHWRLDDADLEKASNTSSVGSNDLPQRNANGIEKKSKKKKYGSLAFSLGDLTLVNNMNYQKPSMKNVPPIHTFSAANSANSQQTSPRSSTSQSQHSSQHQASPRYNQQSPCINNSSNSTPNSIMIPPQQPQFNVQNNNSSSMALTPSPTTPVSIQYSSQPSIQYHHGTGSQPYSMYPTPTTNALPQHTQLPSLQQFQFPVPQQFLMYTSSMSQAASTSTQSNLQQQGTNSTIPSSGTFPTNDPNNNLSPTLSPRSKIARTGISIKDILN